VEALVARRVSGEPLQYVLGRWSFRSLELTVDDRVLIPRPETEQVVEVALAELRRIAGESVVGHRVCVDLGTGSGAIALALATEAPRWLPDLEVWATDWSADALAVAAENLALLAPGDPGVASRVRLARGRWFAALPDDLKGRVDLIVANPPYVSESEYAELDPGVREWEPREALVAPLGAGGVGGMADIETIVGDAPRWLRPGGALVVEIAPAQAYASIDAARRAGFAPVTTERDLAGRLRMLVART
jgi:release factor glutamine methyltransferase